jgi:N-acetylglucosamine-6-phosphate deacetylase
MKAHGAVNEEGRLAGSTAFITDCVRNIAQWGLLSFPDAVQLATYHPAQHLGATPKLGQIVPGATADLILWHKDDLSISTVFLAGQELPELSPTGKLKMAMA